MTTLQKYLLYKNFLLDMLTFSISGEKSVPESGSWTAEEAKRPPHSHRRDHDRGTAAPPGDQRR